MTSKEFEQYKKASEDISNLLNKDQIDGLSEDEFETLKELSNFVEYFEELYYPNN